jgi:hypothetical protein
MKIKCKNPKVRFGNVAEYCTLRFAFGIGVSRRKLHAKKFPVIALTMLFIFMISPAAAAAGLFGTPQTVSRQQGGLNTAIGYRYHEDVFENSADYKIRQNEIYSQAAYGAKNIWEIYARVGVADMKMVDVFRSTDYYIETSKNNFDENWKFSGTLGAKAFYPINKTFGLGAFVQGTYYFGDFTDNTAIISGGMPVVTELKVKNLWDINFGVGFQATLRCGTRLYAGPYIYYSEAKMSLSSDISGLEYAVEDFSVKNKSIVGGYAGADIPLAKGFHLNVEGQFSDEFSAGAAVSYTY